MYRLFRFTFENMFLSEGSPEGPCQASVERKCIGTLRKKSMNRSKAMTGDLAEIRVERGADGRRIVRAGDVRILVLFGDNSILVYGQDQCGYIRTGLARFMEKLERSAG